MLQLALTPAGTSARLAALLIAATLITGCGPDAGSPVSPETNLDLGSTARAAGTDMTTREATNLQFGDFALHVPANVHNVRGILVALGGPDTRGFAVGTPFGAPLPQVEASLQELGVMFRELAAQRGLAILGSGRFGRFAYPDEPASDQELLDALAQAAAAIGRPDLLDAPFLLYGMSGGAPEATGFTQRNPERVAALFLKVPQTAGPLTGQALEIPVYMILAEFDVFVDNAALTAAFHTHRAAGAPWAMAVEGGVLHHSLTPAQRELTVEWMRTVLPLREAGAGIRQLSPQAGWLGDPASGEIAPIQRFVGNPSGASYFVTRPLALAWAAFLGF